MLYHHRRHLVWSVKEGEAEEGSWVLEEKGKEKKKHHNAIRVHLSNQRF